MGLIGIGTLSLLFWVVIIAAVLYLLRSRGGIRIYGHPLVLRRFDLQEAPRDGVFIRIVGRPAGIVYWLMTILRLSEETALEVNRERLSRGSASLRGEIHDLVPLASIASTNCGYVKPLWCLFVAGAIFLLGILGALGSLGRFFQRGGIGERVAGGFGGVAGSLVGAAIFGGIFLVIYWLQRKLSLSVRTRGGNVIGVVFKPSVIENISVDLKRALQAIALLNRKVVEAQFGSVSIATVPANVAGSASACPRCGAHLTPEDHFCGDCGTPVGMRPSSV
jgi:hypothetical protein